MEGRCRSLFVLIYTLTILSTASASIVMVCWSSAESVLIVLPNNQYNVCVQRSSINFAEQTCVKLCVGIRVGHWLCNGVTPWTLSHGPIKLSVCNNGFF